MSFNFKIISINQNINFNEIEFEGKINNHKSTE